MPEITPARIGLALQLPPEEALAFLFGKDSAVYASFKDVQPEVFRTVFTVAGVMKMDVLLAVRKLVEDALQNGESFAEFKKRMSENELIAAVLPTARLQTIYRTNLQSAFMAARYKQQMAIAERKPFWQFVGVMDDSTTRGCRQLDGKVFRYDDDFWKSNYPPRHFNCRSRVIALNQRELERDGSVVNQGKEYSSVKPDPAFATTPTTPWKPDLSKYNTQEKAILQKHLASSGYSPAEEQLFLGQFKYQLKYFKRTPGYEYLSLAEEYAVHYYSSGGFGDLNNGLRTNKLQAEDAAFQKILNTALSKMPRYKLKEGEFLERSIQLTQEQIAAYQIGKVVEWKGFTSTSYDGAPKWNKNVLLRIQSKSGVDISDLSKLGKVEREVLIGSGLKVKVVKVTTKDDRTIIDVKEVS